MQTIEERAATIAHQLNRVYEDPALCEQYAWWILEEILEKTKASLIANDMATISQEQSAKIDEWLHKLIVEKMPLAYLIGYVPFDDLSIFVNPPVLIPRPETEEWTINLRDQLKKLTNKKLNILDLCTGTGCIAIALAKALPEAHVYAIDLADEAIQCAQKNIVTAQASNVALIKSDLFDLLPNDLFFDLIVGNPPYISFEDYKKLDEQVAVWEDPRALVADDQGFAVVGRIIKDAPRYFKENDELRDKKIPQLVLEIDRYQAQRARQALLDYGYCDARVLKDLEGKDRVITGRFVPCGHSHQ